MYLYKTLPLLFALLFSLSLSGCNNNNQNDDENINNKSLNENAVWEKINIPAEMLVTDVNGNEKTINPGCAFSYNPQNPAEPLDAENAYHFYFKQGDSDKLVFFFNGGGACWNDHTCLTSLKVGDRPTYNPTLVQNNTPDESGILSSKRNENPFKDWSKVYLPYCTGDIHVGSKNSVYTDLTGLVSGTQGTKIIVQHRGFDNFLAAQDWVVDKFSLPNQKTKIKKLIASGSSAGGYGATLNLPYLKKSFPEADTALISDGSAAMVSQNFLDTVFSTGSTWGLNNTLASDINGFDQLGNYSESTFNQTLLSGLANDDSDLKIAQYTTAWDAVQVQFLNIMKNPDDPAAWASIPPATFCEWNMRMNQSFSLTSSASNYRYYIGQGLVHTVLTDAFSPEVFYTEDSGGELLTDWLSNLDTINNSNWSNQSCADCGAPFDPQLCTS